VADKDERKITGGNRRLAKKRVQCLNEALCFVSSSVLADSLVLRKPLLRQAPKRWRKPLTNITQKKRHKIMKIRNLKYVFANRNSCRALCRSIKNGQGLFNFLNQIS